MAKNKNVGISNSEDRLKEQNDFKKKRHNKELEDPKLFKKEKFFYDDGEYEENIVSGDAYTGIKDPRHNPEYKDTKLGKKNKAYKKPKRGNNGQKIDTEYEAMYLPKSEDKIRRKRMLQNRANTNN